MSIIDAKNIIKFCASKGSTSIKPFWRGEPTLYPSLIKILKYSKNCGLLTMINTNGSFPINILPDLENVLDWISFSVDDYHHNVNADTFKKIKLASDIIPYVEIQALAKNVELIDFCNNYNIKLKIDKAIKRTPIAQSDVLDLSKFPDYSREICWFPFWRIIITHDLKIKPCCVVWQDGQLEMGSLRDETGKLNTKNIIKIWVSEKYKQLRESVSALKFIHNECENCTSLTTYKI